jgi:hypothetical protein
MPAIAGLLAAGVVILLLGILGLIRGSRDPLAKATDTSPASAPTTTEATTTSTTAPTTAVPSDSSEKFIPVASVEGGIVTLTVEYLDGSTAVLAWPNSMDLLSGGVTPYGWAQIPNGSARDFFIRRGDVDDVISLFGEPELLNEYPDGRGETVRFWRPGDWPDVDFLGFQFDSWAVLVYDYRPGSSGPPMANAEREMWATHLHGAETGRGFLRIFTDPPLLLAPAGAYPSPMSLEFSGADGSFDLVPEDCETGFLGDPVGEEASDWCDSSGLISVRAGTLEFAQVLYRKLEIRRVHLAGIHAPDSIGSYQGLRDQLKERRDVWHNAGITSYRLQVEGTSGLEVVDAIFSIRPDEAVVEAGSWSQGAITVDGLFALIEAAVAQDSGDHEVRFHPDLGYPTNVGLNLDQRQSDGALEIHVFLTPDPG